MSNGHFEAKLHAYRRTQEGAVISFVVHPDEIKKITDLTTAPFGSRYMIAYAEIGDDETPKSEPVAQSAGGDNLKPKAMAERREDAGSSPAGLAKPKRKFSDMSLPEQAGIRCGDDQFETFLRNSYELSEGFVMAEDIVRAMCGVGSRRELSTNREAANLWRKIESEYQSWLLTDKYAETIR